MTENTWMRFLKWIPDFTTMRENIKIAFLLFVFFLSGGLNFCFSQDLKETEHSSSFKLAAQIKSTSDFFTTDHLGNIYVVESHQIKKYGLYGTLQETFSNKNYGAISSIDASDPLRLLVFYNDFSYIMFLEDELSLIGSEINLVDFELDQTTLVCGSWNDGLWLYDPQDFQLKRMNQNLQITHRSGNISQLVGVEINPNFMLEVNNFVYLNNPSDGILVFDQYGTYFKTIPLKGLEQFQLNGDQIFYENDGKLKSYNIKMFVENSLDLPVSKEEIKSIRFERESKLLVIQKENSLSMYLIED